jgi:manganese/zinc/iron transport system permease protein
VTTLFPDDITIMLTAGLVATACALLGVFLVLRRVALMGDAVSHAVLPGIVAVFLLTQSRAPLSVIVGAALFAIICVLAIEWLRGTQLIQADAAIGLVFPALFALGVLGIHRYAANIHLDLDSTIYGEIAFAPFRTVEIGGVLVAQSLIINGAVALVNLALIALLWKELKATTFDPEFSKSIGLNPTWVSRMLLVAVSVTAVTAFESVGAILVVTLLIVPAAAAYLLTDRLWAMVTIAVGIGWISAVVGYSGAVRADASIAGVMGVTAAIIFAIALVASPRYGLLARRVALQRRRRAMRAASDAPQRA